ncbi:MAG: hypothetical protein EBS01_09215 [Verrucomicrobia bacterium]|nr:hypothetical protein [Verrucomicrobiota bacterium]
MDHVSVRCAHYRLLFPSRNIEAIVTLGEDVRTLSPPRRSLRSKEDPSPTLDLSRLLGATAPAHKDIRPSQRDFAETRSRIRLDWVSTDTSRRAALIVDAVDEIVASQLHRLERVPFLPCRLLPLCDGVLRDADSTYRIGIRLDVQWPMASFTDRRIWCNALVSIDAGSPSAAPTRQPGKHPSPA